GPRLFGYSLVVGAFSLVVICHQRLFFGCGSGQSGAVSHFSRSAGKHAFKLSIGYGLSSGCARCGMGVINKSMPGRFNGDLLAAKRASFKSNPMGKCNFVVAASPFVGVVSSQ